MDPDLLDNYRPISILCSFSKIFELTVYEQLFLFFIDKNCLVPHQDGFFAGRSTETALFELTTKIYNSLDAGNVSCGTFLDLS